MLTIKTMTFAVALAVAALCGGAATQVFIKVIGEKPDQPKCGAPKGYDDTFDKTFHSGKIDKTGSDKEY